MVAAYQAMLDAIRAVPVDTLIPTSTDVPAAVTATLGRLPRLLGLRTDLVANLPGSMTPTPSLSTPGSSAP